MCGIESHLKSLSQLKVTWVHIAALTTASAFHFM